MAQCSTEKFYFSDSYSQSLTISIGKILRNNKTKTTLELYDLVKDYLKNQKDFIFGEESNTKKYKDSISLLNEKIFNIIDKLMITFKLESKIQEFKEIMKLNFLADSGIKYDTSTIIEEVEGPAMENNPDMPNEKERVGIKMNKIVKEYYGTVLKANNFRKAEFARELTELTIIDTKNRKIARNKEDLNKNIILLKNKYFRNIVEYLKSIDSNFSYTSDLFGENGNVISGYRQVYNKFYNEIKKLKENKTIENKITEGWKRRLFGSNDLFYDAFNSYINLVYFDTVLKDTIGNVIEVANSAFKDDEWDYSYMKYGFSKGDEHKRKDFRNSENRDALKDIAKFSRVILSTIPIYSTSDGKFLNRYVNIGNFANAITSLFTNIYKLDPKYNKLIDAIENFHDNPSYYSGIIFKKLSNKDNNILIALRNIGVNSFNLNVLTSVFRHVYDESNPNSIKSIEIDNMKKLFNINGYSIVDCINGVIDRTMDATYLLIGYSSNSDNIEVTEKPKYADRKEQYDVINRINSFNFLEGRTTKLRSKLAKKYSVTREKGNTSFSVKFGKIKITGESSSANGILDPKPIKFKFSNSKIKEIFDPNYAGIDLISKESINKIIDGLNLTKEEQIFRDILEFIDSFLETRILTSSGMNLLFDYKSYTTDSENYISDLLQTAFRAAVINNINYLFDEALANKKCKSILDYEAFIKQVYSPFEEILKQKKNDFVVNNLGVPNIVTVRSSEDWIDKWITVKKIASGEVSKSTTKDVHGNAVANNRTSFLGGNLKYYLSKYRKAGELGRTATNPLLFTNNSDLVVKTVFNTDAKYRNGIKKSTKDMCASELFYSSIIFNFYGNYLQDSLDESKFQKSKNNLFKSFLILPTTFSDKISFVTYAIKANKVLDAPGKSYNGKTIYELDTNLTIDLYQDTIGEAYVNLYNNVLDDLRAVLDMPNASFEEINDKLHTLSQEELLTLADQKNIELQLDTHYRTFGDVCKFNELLYHNANDLYTDKKALVKRFESEKVNFVNDLINSGVSFYINYYNDSDKTISSGSSKNMISRIIDLLYPNSIERSTYKNDWIRNNKLIIAKVTDKEGKIKNIIGGLEIPLDSTVELNPLLEKYFYTDSLLSNNLRFELTGSEVAHPDKAKINFTKELKTVGITPKNNPLYFKQINLISKSEVKDPSSLFNLKELLNSEVSYKIVEESWKSEDEFGNMIEDPIKKKTVLKIYLKGKEKLGSFDLVADTNFENDTYNGEYSVHFKTGNPDTGEIFGSTSEERALLYKYLISAIPSGAKVSTWGKISTGGKKALEKIGINMYIVGTREIKDRQGNPTSVNIYQKTEAINKFKDLIWLRNESKLNSKLKPIYDKAILKIEAFAQGTLLKRNVIIPATLQYELNNTLNGTPLKIKVAVIEDTQANIFNFRGDNTTEDAHDGSAFISPLISILENKALQDLEVGVDKKPIWHSFNARLMSATLLKFATFTLTAERMRTSLKSDLSLYKLFKQMHDLAWADFNPDGTVAKWNNSRGIEIDLINTKGFKKGRKTIDFLADIVGDTPLYYEEDNQSYLITDFGRDEKGYYTIEHKSNFLGSRSSNDIKVYHRFDKDGNHFKFIEGIHEIPNITSELHDINSLFQLYNVLGGIYAQSLIEDENGKKKLSYSDAAAYATVNFMNNISVRIGNNTNDMSQRTYYQPLKEMLIGYAANKSAVKNGISNLNSVNAWKGETKLRYMTLDTDGLGIQMDADHEIDESEMTEFSLVISALEAGGRLHGEAKEVYKTLGQLAVQASKFEIDTASAYIYATISKNKKYNGITLEEIRSELYDIFARTIINNYKAKEDRIDIATPIIDKIKETFNLNENHKLDEFKLPNSDNSLYSLIIPTFISNINSKSIKRKYPGSGCVMVPGYGIILNYKYNGKIKLFDDVLKEARQFNQKNNIFRKFDSSKETITKYNHDLVETYLKYIQEFEWVKATESIEQFIPTDKVDVLMNDKYLCTISLDKISDYYSFLGFSILNPDGDLATRDIIRRGFISKVSGVDVNSVKLTFAMNVTKPRDLAPARIRWKYKDAQGVEHIENIFNTKPVRDSFMRKGDKTFDLKANRKLVQEIFDKLDSGTYLGYNIYDLENEAAEVVISNMYASKFKAKGLSLSEILEKGEDYFKTASIPVINSTHYDMAFTTNSGNYKYISFKTPKEDTENMFRPKNVGWKYVKPIGKDLYATTKDGLKLFKIGTYVIKKDISVFGDKFLDSQGNNIENPNLRVNSKGQVVEYKEFISHYKVSEVLNKNKSGGHVKLYDLYVINTKNILEGLANWTEETVNAQISKILSDVYRSSDFNSIRLNNTLLSGSATKLAKVLPTLNVSDDLKNFLIETTLKYLSNIDEKKTIHQIDKSYNKDLKDYYNKVKSSLYSSFLKSLTFTASRIPAQTLLSFMLMKVTAFTLSSKNIAYVSHWQTWLLGSDY